MITRAVQIDRFGGPEVLEVREVPAPRPLVGEVLVRSVAASINPIDWKLRTTDRGLGFPLTLGWDLAGIVLESRASGFRVGDRVVAMSHVLQSRRGTWSDLVVLPAADLAHAPTMCALTEAASLPLAGLTALHAWNATDTPREARALVVGAVGAVGGFYVQLASNRGVAVDGLVSRAEHVGPARKLGAVSATTDPGELADGSYEVVFDTVGIPRSAIDPSRLLTPSGQYVTSSSHADLSAVANASKVLVARDPEGLASLVEMVDAGALQLRVAAVYPIQRVREAHEHFEAGGSLGKGILVF